MLVFNGAQVNSVILNGVSTTGYLNGAMVWGKTVPKVYIPSNFYFSSNSYVKNQGASGSSTAASGELFYISGSSTSGIGFDTAFINAASSPTSNYWGLGSTAIGMRFTASARMPATGIDMRDLKSGYKVAIFGKTEGTGSWNGGKPYISSKAVVSSTISGANGYTSLHTSYASAGSSDTKAFYKVASSNSNTRSWPAPAGFMLTRFSGAFSGVRTGTEDTYTYAIMKVGSSVIGSSRLPYMETGNFTQGGVYSRTVGSAVLPTAIQSYLSSTPNSFSKYTTAGVAWSAMARVP